MKHILDSSFRYKPSFDTDVIRTARFSQFGGNARPCAAADNWFTRCVLLSQPRHNFFACNCHQ